MSPKELADKLDAEDRLTARGYTKEPCKFCKGRGILINQYGETLQCCDCKGEGGEWKRPITK